VKTQTTINGEPVDVTLIKRRGQRRIIVHKMGASAYKVTAPKHVSMKHIIHTIEANHETVSKLPPKLSMDDYLSSLEAIDIFGAPVSVSLHYGPPHVEWNDEGLIVTLKSLSHQNITKHLKQFLKSILLREVNALHAQVKQNHAFLQSPITFDAQFMHSRFGSCIPSKRRINFNLALVHYPKEFLHHIYYHEVAHLVHANHSKAFYQTLTTLDPAHTMHAKALRTLHNKYLRDIEARL